MTMEPCVYCGSTENPTLDHVPPKCLFEKPRPSNLLTVPACQSCNARFSRDDEYFKTAMLFRWDTGGHPAADLRRDSAMRAVARDEAGGFLRLFTESMKSAPIVLHSGLYVEEGGCFEVDGARIENVVKRIVRGLHYSKVGVRLPCEQQIIVLDDESLEQSDPRLRHAMLRALQPMLQGEPEWFGPGEVFGFFWRSADGRHSSEWFIIFWSKIIYYAATAPKGAL